MSKPRVIRFTAIVKRWFDKVNGNTYHSVRIVRQRDNALIVCPFQYGYDEHYRQTALATMFDAGWFKNYKRKDVNSKPMRKSYNEQTVYLFERENNYPILWTVTDGLKRDCVANGQE